MLAEPAMRLITRRIRGIRVAAIIVVVVSLIAFGGQRASATDGTVLPLNGSGWMLVDDSGDHVFLTGNPGLGDASVVVAALDGSVTTTIPNMPGASGLASLAGAVYVAHCGSNELYVVDTSTLAVSGTIDTGAAIGGSCEISISQGRIWFVTPGGVLASVALASPHATATYPGLIDTNAPLLTASETGLLALADTANNSYAVTVYDVSAAAPTPVASGHPDPGTVSWFRDAEMSADGTRLILSGAVMFQVDPADLSVTRIFKSPLNGASFGADGVALAGTLIGAGSGPYALSWAGSRFVRWVGLVPQGSGMGVANHDVALSPDGRRLFLVTGTASYPNMIDPHLWVVEGPALAATTLTVTASHRRITIGRSLKLTAHLTAFDADSVINLYATPAGATRRLIASGHPNASGNLMLTVSPRANTVYQAEAAATGQTGSATSKRRAVHVAVITRAALSGYYATSGEYRLYHYTSTCPSRHRGCPRVVISVTPNHGGKSVNVRFQVKTPQGWVAVFGDPFRLNDRSRVAVILVYRSTSIIGQQLRIGGVFPGDNDHAADSSGWRYFRITR